MRKQQQSVVISSPFLCCCVIDVWVGRNESVFRSGSNVNKPREMSTTHPNTTISGMDVTVVPLFDWSAKGSPETFAMIVSEPSDSSTPGARTLFDVSSLN